jgi:hypothetical protein
MLEGTPTKAPLPTGTLTLLFRDIEGWRRLELALGADQYADDLLPDRFDAIVGQVEGWSIEDVLAYARGLAADGR